MQSFALNLEHVSGKKYVAITNPQLASLHLLHSTKNYKLNKIEKNSGEHYFCVLRARLVKQREDIRRLKLSKEQLELFRSTLISLFKPNDLVQQFLGKVQKLKLKKLKSAIQ
jgi:hypothetical protein